MSSVWTKLSVTRRGSPGGVPTFPRPLSSTGRGESFLEALDELGRAAPAALVATPIQGRQTTIGARGRVGDPCRHFAPRHLPDHRLRSLVPAPSFDASA